MAKNRVLSKDEIREWRRIRNIELVEKSIDRLDTQQTDFIAASNNLERQKIEGGFKLVVNSTLDKIKNKTLRESLKRVIFELNDENPHEGLVDEFLTETYMDALDALGEHAGVWERILADNAISALTDDANSTSSETNKIRDKIREWKRQG